MCIYIIYYYSPFLYINITLCTTKKRRKFSPCPLPHCWSWDISSCPAFGLGLIPTPTYQTYGPCLDYTTSSPRSSAYGQQMVGHLRIVLLPLRYPVCHQLRWFQNARIRGPSSHTNSTRNVSCHLLEVWGSSLWGGGQCRGAHPVSLYFSQSCSAAACPPCSPHGYHQTPGQRKFFAHIQPERSAALLPLSNGSPFLWDQLMPDLIFDHLPLKQYQVTIWKVWGWLSKLIPAQGDSTAMLGYVGRWCQHSLNPLAVSRMGIQLKPGFW